MISFSDLMPFLFYLNNEYINTGLEMKVNNLNRNSNDLWTVENSEQVITFQNFQRFQNTYELFYNSNVDIEYILYKSFQSCIKIYVKFNRLVITIRNNDTIPDIETIKNLANQMNIENIQINIRP